MIGQMVKHILVIRLQPEPKVLLYFGRVLASVLCLLFPPGHDFAYDFLGTVAACGLLHPGCRASQGRSSRLGGGFLLCQPLLIRPVLELSLALPGGAK